MFGEITLVLKLLLYFLRDGLQYKPTNHQYIHQPVFFVCCEQVVAVCLLTPDEGVALCFMVRLYKKPLLYH